MKVRKNFEAVFLVAAVMANFTAYAIAEVPAEQAVKAPAVQAVVVNNNMHVVVVKGKRLTAQEKAALN